MNGIEQRLIIHGFLEERDRTQLASSPLCLLVLLG
jgi:hypothetical protein